MGRKFTGRDPLKYWANLTWHNMNKRAQVDFSKFEFYLWCGERRHEILALYVDDKPSIDRIDPWLHYTLDNIQVIPYKENCRQGGEIKCLRATDRMENKYIKYCLHCGERITRKQHGIGGKWEATPQFIKRLTCNKYCSIMLRKRNSKGQMQREHTT